MSSRSTGWGASDRHNVDIDLLGTKQPTLSHPYRKDILMSFKTVKHQSFLLLLFIGIAAIQVPAFSAGDANVPPGTTVTVTAALDGKPLANGRIFFHLPKNQFAGAKIESGKCQLDCVPAGIHRVTIESKGLPKRYSSPEQTGLVVEITPGNNNFAFELSSD